MQEVVIVTRDINSKRTDHYLRWDRVCTYIQDEFTDEDEILLVIVEDICVYSQLGHSPINRMELIDFFFSKENIYVSN